MSSTTAFSGREPAVQLSVYSSPSGGWLPPLMLTVMRKLWLTYTFLLLGICSVSRAGPGWQEDRQCFREQIVFFRTGSSLLNAEAQQHIAEVANYLKAHPSAAVRIDGHCDDRGSQLHNRSLGDRRARAVCKELVRLGVAVDHTDTVSYGKESPAATGHDAKARQMNRRAEFVLLPPPKE